MRDLCHSPRSLTPDDATYFRARAVQEQIAAQSADCAHARDRHGQLAAMYRFRAAMLANPLQPGRWLENFDSPSSERDPVMEDVIP